jgi:type II secretory pathway component PulM
METPKPHRFEHVEPVGNQPWGKPETKIKGVWKMREDNPNESNERRERNENYITYRIKPRNLERLVYILIIIALFGALVYSNMFKPCGESSKKEVASTQGKVQQSAGQETKLPAVTANASGNITANPNPLNQTNKPSNQTQAQTNQTKKLNLSSFKIPDEGPIVPALVDFTVNRVGYVKKTETWAKVTNIDITINNRGNKLRPTIKVYAFDSTTPTEVANRPIGSAWNYEIGLEKGEEKTFSIDTTGRSISFSDFSSQKTVRLELFDSRTNISVKEATKTFTIS